MPQVKICNLRAGYLDRRKNETVVLENFNVEFDNEKINVIIGPSGCGKTTLLKCICQQLDYSGDILFDDVDISTLKTRKMNIGYINQSLILYPKMTVFENIAFPLIAQRVHPDDINYLVRKVADKLDITPCLTRRPKEISLGQAQRVAIARALIKQPTICLFDEALTNLDKPLARELRVLLKKTLTEFKCTAIYVTHDYVEAMTLADKLFVMKDSKIEISGEPYDLLDSGNETIEYLKKSALVEKEKE